MKQNAKIGWTTTAATDFGRPPTAELADEIRLVMVGEQTCASFPLPESGVVRIGRGPEADFRFPDPSVSRLHASIEVKRRADKVEIWIEDLSSANGTAVRGARLEAGEKKALAFGQMVDIGKVSLIVQRAPRTNAPKTLWSHADFELRLGEECERARHSSSRFSVLRASVKDLDRVPALDSALCELLRTFDVVGSFAPREYEAILVDTPQEVAQEIAARLRERLAEVGTGVDVGIAECPSDGRRAALLLEIAGARMRSETWVDRTDDTGANPFVLSPSMRELHRVVERVALSDASIVVFGEAGSGKSRVAELIHARSRRAEGPFVRVNCAANSDSSLDVELFGDERAPGRSEAGLIEAAEGGTLFLDELGDMPPNVQAKLLRAIETLRIVRVGGIHPRKIDVRIVASTSRDLGAECAAGNFRRDLFYRIAAISLDIPPLRARREEIAQFALHFAQRALENAHQFEHPRIAEVALAALDRHAWPGNLRELKNMMETAVLLAGGPDLELQHFPIERLRPSIGAAPIATHTMREPRTEEEMIELTRLLEVLENCGGNQSQAALMLGIARSTLATKLDYYGVPRPRKGRIPARPKK